jgi:hypothetical protein
MRILNPSSQKTASVGEARKRNIEYGSETQVGALDGAKKLYSAQRDLPNSDRLQSVFRERMVISPNADRSFAAIGFRLMGA